MRAAWLWWRRWGIAALSLAWLVEEVAFAVDPIGWGTRPLTAVLVEETPAWFYMPASVALALWLPPHLWRAGRRVTARRRRDRG